jgi:hypothetical protein
MQTISGFVGAHSQFALSGGSTDKLRACQCHPGAVSANAGAPFLRQKTGDLYSEAGCAVKVKFGGRWQLASARRVSSLAFAT